MRIAAYLNSIGTEAEAVGLNEPVPGEKFPDFEELEVMYHDKNHAFVYSGPIRYFGLLSGIEEPYRQTLSQYVKSGSLRIEGNKNPEHASLGPGIILSSEEFVFMKHGEGK